MRARHRRHEGAAQIASELPLFQQHSAEIATPSVSTADEIIPPTIGAASFAVNAHVHLEVHGCHGSRRGEKTSDLDNAFLRSALARLNQPVPAPETKLSSGVDLGRDHQVGLLTLGQHMAPPGNDQ